MSVIGKQIDKMLDDGWETTGIAEFCEDNGVNMTDVLDAYQRLREEKIEAMNCLAIASRCTRSNWLTLTPKPKESRVEEIDNG